MKITLVKSKIHRATVTDGDIDYQGSITIGRELLEAAGIVPCEMVHVNNVSNAAHWETYVIPGRKGEIILNGAPARLFQRGDKVVIFATAQLEPSELKDFRYTSVFVNEKNDVVEVKRTAVADLSSPAVHR